MVGGTDLVGLARGAGEAFEQSASEVLLRLEFDWQALMQTECSANCNFNLIKVEL